MTIKERLAIGSLEFCGLLMGIMLYIPLICVACWCETRSLFACFSKKGQVR